MKWLCEVLARAMAMLLAAYPGKGRSQDRIRIWYMESASAFTILMVLTVRPVKIFTMTYLGNPPETKPMLAKVRQLFSYIFFYFSGF